MIGWTERGGVGSEVCLEVDLRSEKKEERTIRFIVDGKIQKSVIVGVGTDVRFGVCCNTFVFLFIWFIRLHFIVMLGLDLLAIGIWSVQGRGR